MPDDDDVLPPTGNRHPDVSWEAAETAKLAALKQRRRINWMLCWATQDGGRGITEQDLRLVYNKYFPSRPDGIQNDTASRLQELRGESKDSPYNPAWAEYITDEQPINDREKLSRRRNTTQRRWGELGPIFLARENHNPNFALCQRATDVPAVWDDACEVQEELIELLGVAVVQKLIEDIRSYAGIPPQRRRLWRPSDGD